MLTEKAPKGHILTYTGKFFNPLDANPDDIDLWDIAHALSNLCRYNGHVNHFYSVAQHSVLCAQRFEPGSYLRKRALMHDASEAYLGDVVAPLKHSGYYEFYIEAEERIMNAICDKYGWPHEEPEEVKEVDIKMRGAEMRDLKDYYPEDSHDTYGFKIKPWLPSFSRAMFLEEAVQQGLETYDYILESSKNLSYK